MKLCRLFLAIVIGASCLIQASAAEEANRDWPNLARYRTENARVGPPGMEQNRVVFMGDSITEFWDRSPSGLFSNQAYINRGISGQTTPQMLIRFRPDVIELKPKLVVILAGTNDIAGNTGPVSIETIAGNIESMAELAGIHGIKVVLASVLPADHYYWIPEIKPARQIVALNQRIKAYAERHDLVYLDYYTPMANETLGLKKEYSTDGVHPVAAGYDLMTALAEKAILKALQAK